MSSGHSGEFTVVSRRISRRRLLRGAAVAGLGLAIAPIVGCRKEEASSPTETPSSQATTSSTPSSQTLKIGVVAPLSGLASFWGQGWVRGAQMAAEEISASGGADIGGRRYLPRVVSADEETGGGGGAQAATKLVFQEKVKHIIGPIGSTAALAMQPITEDNKVLLMTGTWAREVIGPKKPFSFRIVTTVVETAQLFYQWVKDSQPQVKTVVLVNPDNVEGQRATEATEKAATELGFQVLSKELFPLGTSDFYPLFTRIIARRPDMIDLSASDIGVIGLQLKQARELGYKGLMLSPGGGEPRIISALAGPENAEGFVTAYLDWDGPYATQAQKDFRQRVISKYGDDKWDPILQATYDAVHMLVAAMQKAGSTDPGQVKDALEDIEFQGVGGSYRFGGQKSYGIRRQVIMPAYVSQIQNGRLVTLVKAVPEVA